MITRTARRLSVILLCLAALGPPDAVEAGQLKVTPVRVELDADRPLGVITVGNPGDEPVLLHLRIREWNHRGGQDVFSDTRDVLLNPMIFELQPQQEQLVRIGLIKPNTSERERAFRLFVQEVPSGPVVQKRRIATYLRISLPLFVAPAKPDVPILTWHLEPKSAEELVLRVENRGNQHAEINSVSLLRANGKPVAAIDRRTYILAGQPRQWTIPAGSFDHRELLTLTAASDRGTVRAALKLGQDGPVEEAQN